MVGRNGFTRQRRLGLVAGVLFATAAFATVAFADTVTADADVVAIGTQTSVSLGTVAPGESITRSVGFTLTCTQKKHVDLSETVTIEFRAVGSGSAAPSGGSLTASNTSIGPVPASWPDDDANCPSPTPVLAATPSTVTLTAPVAGGNYSYTVSYRIGVSGPSATAGDNSSDVTGSGSESVTYTLTVPSKQSQAITFPAIADRVFGDADFAAGASASSGLAVSYDAVGNCTVGAAGTVHIGAAGNCTVTASQGGNDSYNAAAPVSRSFNIAKASQTISFPQPTSPQAFGIVFAVSASSDSGLGVAIAAAGVCSYNGMTGMVTITSGTGDCVLTASQSGNDNFNAASDVVRTVSASKAAQEISFAEPSATYGDADSNLDPTATSGLPVALATSTPATCTIVGGKLHVVAAGSCTVTASQPGDDNYAPATDVTHTFTIAKAAATLTLGDLDKTYNGAPHGVDVTTSPSGLSGVSVSYDGGATAPTKSGAYAVVAALDNPNYAAADATGTLTIAPKELTASFTAENKVYDGTTAATIASRSLDGVVGGDAVALTSGTAEFEDENAGIGKHVTASGFVLVGDDAANYVLASGPWTTTADIERKALSVTAPSPGSIVYGDALPSLAPGLSGLVAGEDESVLESTPACDLDPAYHGAGTYDIVCTGGSAANYSFSYENGSLTVERKELVAAFTVADKEYDGTSAATIADRGLTGVIAGDTVELGGGTATFEDENVGDEKSVGATGFVLTGDDAGNYVLGSGPWSTTADITAKELSGGFTAKSKVYDGTRTATLAGTSLPGVVGDDHVTLDVTNVLFDDENVGVGKNVAGDLSLSGADAGNYRLATASASTTADITPKGLTITASSPAAIVLGSPAPAVTPIFDGFVPGDDAGNSLTTAPMCGTTYTPVASVGTYPTSCAGAVALNYAATYVQGALRVLFAWNGFLQPINDTAHQTGLQQSKFRLGQTIPVKFVLRNAAGATVQQSPYPTFTRSANRGSCDPGATLEPGADLVSPDTVPEYRWDGSQYHYNWSTKGLTAGVYRIYANLADATKPYVDICLTK
jgi:MBG domain/YDG domain/MBG domain (YGX type)